jgi:uncharacterized membrane protein YdjX (TVP38/TMEM64 family)
MNEHNIIPHLRDLLPIPTPFHGVVILLSLVISMLLTATVHSTIANTIARQFAKSDSPTNRRLVRAVEYGHWPMMFLLCYPFVSQLTSSFIGSLFRGLP